MAEYNIDDIRTRYLKSPPVNQRRLENTSLDIDVPLEHNVEEVLPLETHETLGVGYGLDRLVAIDLNAERPVPHPLPSRHELMKYSRDKLPHNLAYAGFDHLLGGTGLRTINDPHPSDYNNFNGDGALGVGNSRGVFRAITNDTVPENKMEDLAKAFIGTGTNKHQGHTHFGYFTKSANANSDVELDPASMMGFTNSRAARNMLQFAYNAISPSAWETLLTNRKVWAEMPKLLPYLDKAFFSLYERDKMGAFKTRVRNPDALFTMLSMVEAMYSIRRGRFSKNVAKSSALGYSNTADTAPVPDASYYAGGEPITQLRGLSSGANPSAISNGVVNQFFMYMENGNHKTLIAPWWFVSKLNFEMFLDTDRDEEIRDVERKDITEFFTLLTEAAEYEKGLLHSSNSNLPMLLFDKMAEAKFKDFSQFKDTKVSLAATLMGYNNARDAYYETSNPGIGRVPYFSDLTNSAGQMIGGKKAEFVDRLKEHERHTVLSPSPEWFKKGMQLANGFSYTTNVTRTRFGDHSMTMNVHPFGFFRGVNNASDCLSNFAGTSRAGKLLNLFWYPVYNWAQLSSSCTTEGLLPDLANGAAYATGLSSSGIKMAHDSGAAPVKLWFDRYYQPGIENYNALLLKSTDQMFQSWIDRGEQVRAEGAVFPTFTQINLMAEMTYTTPLAMIQRNFPYLRKMLTRGSTSAVPAHGNTSFDFMTAGDNFYGTSVFHNANNKTGPFALRDRQLFNPDSHLRTGGVELLPVVVPLTKPPENWKALFQLRDMLYWATSLGSEPIMDAYTSSITASATNGYGSARLVLYQGPKSFEGIVDDVYCTPIVGVGRDDTGTVDFDYSLPATNVSVMPTAIDDENNYVMFLLGADKIEGGLTAGKSSVLVLRKAMGTGNEAQSPYGDDTIVTLAVRGLAGALTEDDFIPGLYWDKKWLSPWPSDAPIGAGAPLSWAQAFSHPNVMEAVAGQAGIGYLKLSTGSPSYELGHTPDSDAVHLAAGTVPTSIDMDEWRVNHGDWIELVRRDLEYQRSAPTFYVFDADITDKDEAYLRMSLFAIGKTTNGPMTFIGGLGAEGQQTMAETLTGDTVFEIIDLSTGSGIDLDESPSEPDDESAGEENPSLHIATQQDV